MLEHFFSYLTEDRLTELFQSYRAFGPLIAVLLPLIEAFLPFLPLIVFVVANTNSFGLWEGFILSWLGSTAGAVLVFLSSAVTDRGEFSDLSADISQSES